MTAKRSPGYKVLELDPTDADGWTIKGISQNKGSSLQNPGRNEEAIHCYNKAVELDPRAVAAWIGKAVAKDELSQWREAAHSYQRFLALAPAQQYGTRIGIARKRLRELGR